MAASYVGVLFLYLGIYRPNARTGRVVWNAFATSTSSHAGAFAFAGGVCFTGILPDRV
eukprot:COSAG02_NODE_64954_length_259_cov_0.650000_1_plen_58_part_10